MLKPFKCLENIQSPSGQSRGHDSTDKQWVSEMTSTKVLIQSAATSLLADTQKFRSLSPLPKLKFHLKVTTCFNFIVCCKDRF